MALKNISKAKPKISIFRPGTRQFLQGWGLIIVFVVICGWLILSPIFLKPSNLINVIRQVSVIGTAAVGMAILMISGGIDLSIGSHLAFSGLVVAIMMNNFHLPVPIAIVITLIASIGIGFINSFVTKIKIPPLIATLGMMSALRGFGYVITKGYPIYDFPTGFLDEAWQGLYRPHSHTSSDHAGCFSRRVCRPDQNPSGTIFLFPGRE